jgi:hypothetical protein
LDEIKKQYKVAAASWAIEEAVPFYMFGRPTFRNMFKPFNKKADQVTNIDRRDIQIMGDMQRKLH